MQEKKKIVITGGHHNSALSVADHVKENDIAEVVWFGHKYTMLNNKRESAEYKEVLNHGIKFYDIKAGKVYKTYNLLHWIRIPYSIWQSFIYLLKERPDLVVSFGGYIAAPVVIAAKMLRIPVVTHEQTTVVGMANSLIARFARKIFVTWPQSKQYFPQDKVVITGLPLRKSIFKFKKDAQYFSDDRLFVYITGGKQGSHVINQAVKESLPDLLEQVNIFHQTGANTQVDDFAELQKSREDLPAKKQSAYKVQEYVYEDEIGQVFHEADLVISRAGAHTTYELAALGKPVLFIPIPWVSHNEQYKNARVLVNAGLATILAEEKLDAESLKTSLHEMINNLTQYRNNAENVKSQIIFDANERIIDEIRKILEN